MLVASSSSLAEMISVCDKQRNTKKPTEKSPLSPPSRPTRRPLKIDIVKSFCALWPQVFDAMARTMVEDTQTEIFLGCWLTGDKVYLQDHWCGCTTANSRAGERIVDSFVVSRIQICVEAVTGTEL